MNYRLAYPRYTVFDQIEDIDTAMRWIVANAGNYEGDTSQIYIAGHSSGAVLALTFCLLSINDSMRKEYGLSEINYSFKKVMLDCGLIL